MGRDYLACSAAKRQGVCKNRATIRRQKQDDLVLDALRTRLMAPALVAEFIRAFTTEWNRLLAEPSGDRAIRERELAQVQRKLAGLIDALAEGISVPGVQQKLDELDARRAAIEAELRAPPPPRPACIRTWPRSTASTSPACTKLCAPPQRGARRWRSCAH